MSHTHLLCIGWWIVLHRHLNFTYFMLIALLLSFLFFVPICDSLFFKWYVLKGTTSHMTRCCFTGLSRGNPSGSEQPFPRHSSCASNEPSIKTIMWWEQNANSSPTVSACPRHRYVQIPPDLTLSCTHLVRAKNTCKVKAIAV